MNRIRSYLRMNRYSLRFSLALSYLVLVLVGLTATGLYWLRQQETAAETALLSHLKERARLLASLESFDHLDQRVFHLPAPIAAVNSNLRVYLVTPDFHIHQISDLGMTDYQRQVSLEMVHEALNGYTVAREVKEAGDERNEILYAAAPVYDTNQDVVGAVCLVLPMDAFRITMDSLRRELFLFSAILAILSLLFGIELSVVMTRPLSNAGEMAARVAGGDYSVRLSRKGPRELAELADHLNQMAENLDTQSQVRKQLLSNMTHELARPLGALQVGIDSLRAGAMQDPDLADDLLAEIGRTLRQTEAMVEDLALAARPQEAPLNLQFSQVALKPFLHGIRSRFWPKAEANGIQLNITLDCELPAVRVDERRITQVLGNLIENSLKFTPAGGEVTLRAQEEGPWIDLLVQDTGPGIPAEELARVSETFYQGRSGRRVLQGMGLGLAIVRQLTEAHGGIFTVENVPGGGLLARVRLPKQVQGNEKNGKHAADHGGF